jgi:uncharacterized protein (DUF1778 family)
MDNDSSSSSGKRQERIFARVSPEEKEQLQKLAARFGYGDLSKFLRNLSQIFELAGVEPQPGGLTANS